MILNPIDQRIRDAGFNFVPFNRFLASPFQIPQGETATDPNTGAGIVTLPMGGGGSGGGALQAGDIDYDSFASAGFDAYANRQPTPLVDETYQSRLNKTFMGFPSYREQQLTGPDIGEYIGSGIDIPLELTTAGKIQHHSNMLYIQGGSGGIVLRDDGGSDRWAVSSDGHWFPQTNNTYDIGTSSYRVRNLYVNDAHFSNEGSTNSVDGTWGDWTLQEGEDDIFMLNNRTGKKYKMALQEVG